MKIPARIVRTRPLKPIPTTRKEVTMSNCREAWLCVHQDADDNQETELITIERASADSPPVIELTNDVRITCTQPAAMSAAHAERAAA
jgi:hypothetical protein